MLRRCFFSRADLWNARPGVSGLDWDSQTPSSPSRLDTRIPFGHKRAIPRFPSTKVDRGWNPLCGCRWMADAVALTRVSTHHMERHLFSSRICLFSCAFLRRCYSATNWNNSSTSLETPTSKSALWIAYITCPPHQHGGWHDVQRSWIVTFGLEHLGGRCA